MKKNRWFLLFILAGLLVVFGARVTQAQSDESRYFPETGHWVEGEFLVKYESVENPELVFGNPITEKFRDTISLIDVQYFEHARFELRPDEFPVVQLTPLGELIYEPRPALVVQPNTQACKSFQSDGPPVCFEFLRFFEEYGGVSQFGFPISGFEIHDGRIVQYFQRGRFEWHPELSSGNQVVLSNLGQIYFLIHGENPYYLKPASSDYIPQQNPQSLKIRAFPEQPIMSVPGYQTIYITVQDQYSQPIAGATVSGYVNLPDGQTITLPEIMTNEKGIAIAPAFLVSTYSIGVAEVVVQVKLGEIEKQAGTSFHIW